MKKKEPTLPVAPADKLRLFWAAVFGLGALFFLLRVELLSQSLWYDEMYTVIHYASQPWSKIVAGDYSPNNHIFSSLLIKASEAAGSAIGAWKPLLRAPMNDGYVPVLQDTGTLRFRLPAVIAGMLAALAMAWPLRWQRAGDRLLPFCVLALLAGTTPWLLAFSTEARGYAIALCLTVLATHIVVNLTIYRWIAYVLLMTAAIYTLPFAGTILAGHGIALALLHRRQMARWALASAVVLAASAALYGPFYAEMSRQGRAMPATHYGTFVFETLQHAATGWNTLGWWAVALVVIVLAAGLPLAWREVNLRTPLVSFTATTAIAMLLPLAFPALGQARLIFWLIPPMVLGCYGLVMGWPPAWARIAKPVAALLITGWMAWQIVTLAQVPPSPVMDALLILDKQSPADARVLGIHLGTQESYLLYHPAFGKRTFDPVRNPERFNTALDAAKAQGRQQTWALVVFPAILHQSDPELEQLLQANGQCVLDLPGRLDHVQLYRMRGEPAASAPTSGPRRP